MALCSVQEDFVYNFQVHSPPGILTLLRILKDILRRNSRVFFVTTYVVRFFRDEVSNEVYNEL